VCIRARGCSSGLTTSRFVVACRPSKRPVAARIMPPVQTDITTESFARVRMKSSVTVFAVCAGHPGPPVMIKASAGGQSSTPYWAKTVSPLARTTGPGSGATVSIWICGPILRAMDSTPNVARSMGSTPG